MSSKELYNSFNPKDNLSRDVLNDHLSGNKTLDPTELDEFDLDAMEGWKKAGVKDVEMSKLDKRFNSKPSNLFLYFGLFSLCIAVGLFFFLTATPKREVSQVKKETKKKLVEVTDLYIAEKYDTLVEENVSNQTEIKLLQKKQEDQPIIKKEEKIQHPIFMVDKLPTLEIKIKEKELSKLPIQKKKIKEIYLSDFKLVDYRVLRNKPKVATQQLDLTGTSANKEDTNSIEEEPLLKKVDIPYYDYIDKTMYLLNRGNLKKALNRFDLILKTYDDDINALFYSGFVFYNLGEFDEASSYFTKALRSEIANFDDEASWYLGLCFEKQNKGERAKEIFQSIANSSSFYSEEAKKKLK